ncbi:MAG: DUF2789 domain-containing protein [Burkholderiales bacterium]|nr:DUF2789 domain-containing protein [Burkholderiales bacterium]
METNLHNLANLFKQLGLPSEPSAIDAFVSRHKLDPGVSLCKAPFWSASQAQFLTQAIANDSDWAEAADDLAVRLS